MQGMGASSNFSKDNLTPNERKPMDSTASLKPNKLLPSRVVSLRLRSSCVLIVLPKCLAMILIQVGPQSLASVCM